MALGMMVLGVMAMRRRIERSEDVAHVRHSGDG
jgi:hypothetical protein